LRVALIVPKWHERVTDYPPLGLAYLGAVLERGGHTARIFDFGLRPCRLQEEDIADVAAFGPDLIGFTVMTGGYHNVEQSLGPIKAVMPSVPIVLGGPHPTMFPEEIAATPGVDFVVYGEGEETLMELVAALQSGATDFSDILGLAYARNDELVRTPERPLIRDLDALPLPARHLLELDKYPLAAPNGEKMLTVLSSRGCPFNCSYCFKGIVGRTYRQRSPENILAELRHLKSAYGARNFYFIDDLFTINTKRLMAISQMIIDEGLDIRWQCLGRVDRVAPESLSMMYRAGCRELHYGIESGNPEVLAATGKNITLDQVRQAVKWTAQSGIRGKGYFMLGLPGDTEETMEQTIRFACELELDEAMFSITTPFPGTRLWDELVKKHPETKYSADFTRAYYYNAYTEEIAPFMNVSEVSDTQLGTLALIARQRFEESKRRRRYLRAFGPRLGAAAWAISRVAPVRAVGRALAKRGLFKRFASSQKDGKRAWD